MKGVSVEAKDGPWVIQDRPMPKLRPGYILVKTAAVAWNPSDIVFYALGWVEPGALVGCDYAGTVVDVGPDVNRQFKKGDRVCGCTRPADPDQFENGTFAEYIVVKADVQLHIPDRLSFENAAAFGVVLLTTGRAFFDKFGIEYPSLDDDVSKLPKRQVLVYGGSSAIGTMVIQYAKLAGFYVLTTASAHNHELVRSYGADFVVDYHSPTAIEELVAHATAMTASHGPLSLCMDCISSQESSEFCGKVLTPTPEPEGWGQRDIMYSHIGVWAAPIPGVKMLQTIGFSFLGEDMTIAGQRIPASHEDFVSAMKFAEISDKLIAVGKIKNHPIDLRTDGLQGLITTGWEDLKAKKTSGKKIVYSI